MMTETSIVPSDQIAPLIRCIREHRVILDRDLAALYGVETRALIQAVKRNMERFAADFMFRLTAEEAAALRSQFVILKPGRGRYSKYSALCLHRTRCAHGRQHPQQPARRRHERLCHSCFRQNARGCRRQRGHSQTPGRDRQNVAGSRRDAAGNPPEAPPPAGAARRNRPNPKLASTSKKTPSLTAPASEEKPKQNICCDRRANALHHFSISAFQRFSFAFSISAFCFPNFSFSSVLSFPFQLFSVSAFQLSAFCLSAFQHFSIFLSWSCGPWSVVGGPFRLSLLPLSAFQLCPLISAFCFPNFSFSTAPFALLHVLPRSPFLTSQFSASPPFPPPHPRMLHSSLTDTFSNCFLRTSRRETTDRPPRRAEDTDCAPPRN